VTRIDQLARGQRQIDALAGAPIDPARVRKLLADFRLLYKVAIEEERAELLRLLIARIDFHGKGMERRDQLPRRR
jgi:hypothetical protein